MNELNIGWWFLILLGGIVVFVFFGQTFLKILKWGWSLILKVGIGFIVLFLINLVGQFVDFSIPLNFITASITGILGVPGLATLILIKILIL